jgi:ribosomal protein L37AE/L43A
VTDQLACPICERDDRLAFVVGDLWHCDGCQATGDVVDGELRPPDAENSSRTRVVTHYARMVSSVYDLERDQAESIVRYVLDSLKWGLPPASELPRRRD